VTASGPFLVVPVCVARVVVGLLYLPHPPGSLIPPHEFADHARRFAGGLGSILERELLYERFRSQRVRMRESLTAVEQIMTSLDTGVDLVRLVGRDHADTVSAVGLSTAERSSSWDEVLTARERDVMALLILGHDNAAIARDLAVAPSTAKSHVRNVMRKLEAVNRTELISRYHGAASDPGWRPRRS
jgi:DNA-binding CsgD family transcriptional regulator